MLLTAALTLVLWEVMLEMLCWSPGSQVDVCKQAGVGPSNLCFSLIWWWNVNVLRKAKMFFMSCPFSVWFMMSQLQQTGHCPVLH